MKLDAIVNECKKNSLAETIRKETESPHPSTDDVDNDNKKLRNLKKIELNGLKLFPIGRIFVNMEQLRQ